jgi:hypothetical protein
MSRKIRVLRGNYKRPHKGFVFVLEGRLTGVDFERHICCSVVPMGRVFKTDYPALKRRAKIKPSLQDENKTIV